MGKFNFMFPLLLVVALFSCGQVTPRTGSVTPKTVTGEEKESEGAGTATDQLRTGEMTGARVQASKGTTGQSGAGITLGVKTSAEIAARETAAAFQALKVRRDAYEAGMAKLKTDFEAPSSQNKVEIPFEVTLLTTSKDQPKIHASLGYNNTTHKELDESIKALQLSSGNKKAEIDIVTGGAIAISST
ncbi:hypothetical protein [Borrelia sp. RT5S]|uniref:hypothetical protein n=1 Tax=Borrelia sp. RT5S TaxID=2898581 RepID=UPI001E45A2EC|nr:hypothetical protein [Borrelia sp. RT5S]UGQ16801.1 hypothetical protein LSO06_05620 [Borrelia sp. RT5S]